MLATEAQERTAETKRLVFTNLVNGVPPQAVAEAFRLSVAEVQGEFDDVLHKIKCYMRDRDIVGFDQLEGLAVARRDRVIVLHVLSRLGAVYLSSPPRYKRFSVQRMDQQFVVGEMHDGFMAGFGR